MKLLYGEWSETHGIGKMQVTIEGGSGAEDLRKYTQLRSKIRLGNGSKRRAIRDSHSSTRQC
jgi:hypothetical protein